MISQSCSQLWSYDVGRKEPFRGAEQVIAGHGPGSYRMVESDIRSQHPNSQTAEETYESGYQSLMGF